MPHRHPGATRQRRQSDKRHVSLEIVHATRNSIVDSKTDVIHSAAYSAFATGPIMVDHDNTVKSYSVSPSMLGRGHILMEPDGPVWVGFWCLAAHTIRLINYPVEREHVGLPSATRCGIGRWFVYDHQHAQVYTERWNSRASNATCSPNAGHVDDSIHSQPFLVHKIYQLDYSRKTGEFRMLEHFLPQVNPHRRLVCHQILSLGHRKRKKGRPT